MKNENWFARNVEPIMSIALLAMWVFGYFVVGKLIAADHSFYSLATTADRRLPFVPYFVYPYVALYPVFLLPFFLVRDREFFKVFGWSYVTVMIACYLVFWNFPVAVERPTFAVVDFTTWALNLVYKLDVPANCFPSMHAAMSMMAALTVFTIDHRRGVWVIFVTLMIGLSALLVKQHYIADILAGFGIAILTYHAYFRQRIHEAIAEDLRRVPRRIDQAFEDALERRLEPLIDRKIEEKLQDLLAKVEAARRNPPK